nr:MAG TPA: hypothetical protein [Caudoviricetes sp.]
MRTRVAVSFNCSVSSFVIAKLLRSLMLKLGSIERYCYTIY